MADKMRMAVVGCGAIGRVHAKAIAGLDEAQLVAVCDVGHDRAIALADDYGCKAYSDYRQMFDTERLDMVSVCTPSGTRLDICEAASSKKTNLLVEKPLDITLERASRIVDVCESAGVKLGSVFQLRFMPVYSQLKRAVSEGRFGKLILGNTQTICYRSDEYYHSGGWRGTVEQDGGGALMNQGIHSVDLLRWIMGDVKSVFAYKGSLTHDIEVEDTVAAVVEFANGAKGTIEATTSVKHGIDKRLEIMGENGTVIVAGNGVEMWRFEQSEEHDDVLPAPEPLTRKGIDPKSPLVEDVWGHQQQILDMMNAIREDRQPAVTGKDGKKAVELVLAIYESTRTGKRVVLGEN